ncbi:MAG: CvpA family protein [Clostridiales Family XIII bacterium]|jgi:uncharacterized membrane protein required for colicin V production|nr:CvpA family protein [Clostridiales Family XIII bacterium]
MQLDIAILIILAIFVILGFKNGFVHTFFFVFGWFIAFVVAFFTRGPVRDFMAERTPLYDWYHGHVYNMCMKVVSGYTDKLTGGATGQEGALIESGELDATGLTDGALDGAMEGLGGIYGSLEGAIGSIGNNIVQTTAEQVTSTTFGILCFIGTVLVVKFVIFLITLSFSRKHHGGVVGALDATCGLFLGALQGFIVVFVLLILVLPVSFAISPDLFASTSRAFDTSFIAKTLLLHNPLLPLMDGIAPGLFDPAEWAGKLNLAA